MIGATGKTMPCIASIELNAVKEYFRRFNGVTRVRGAFGIYNTDTF